MADRGKRRGRRLRNGDDGDHAEDEDPQRCRKAIPTNRYRQGDASPRQPQPQVCAQVVPPDATALRRSDARAERRQGDQETAGQVARPARGRQNNDGTREAGDQRPQEAQGCPRTGQRLPGAAVTAVPQGQGAAPPLDDLRLPRPQGPQGQLPAAVDPADQRRGPGQRHDLQPVHPGPAGRRGRGRPADAGRTGRRRRVGLRGPGRGGQEGPARRVRLRGRVGVVSADIAYAGAHSPRLKAARRLTKRAFRQRERAFLAEGPQAVAEAFHCGARVTDLFVTVPARSRHHDLITAMAGAGISVHVVSGEIMDELAQTVTPQGLLAVCGFIDVPLSEIITPAPSLVALLANVRDPGNAGTVLRTADAAGARAVVFADASVDPYNGKCVRASAGSLFHLPVVAGARLEDAVHAMRQAGLRVVAADGRAGRSLDEPDVQARLSEPTAWMFGNEAWGLPPDLVALADEPVAVPIYGKAESLNLAAAAAVCLYASARAQRVHRVTGQAGT